jgi:hypothetical protein
MNMSFRRFLKNEERTEAAENRFQEYLDAAF